MVANVAASDTARARRRAGLGGVVGARGDRHLAVASAGRSARPRTRSRWSSMNSTISGVGGRAPPRRKRGRCRRIVVGPAQLADLPLEVLDPLRVRAGRTPGRSARRRSRPDFTSRATSRDGSPTARADPLHARVHRRRRVPRHGLDGQPDRPIRNSCGYFLGAGMTPILPGMRASAKPGTIHRSRRSGRPQPRNSIREQGFQRVGLLVGEQPGTGVRRLRAV